jgi:hypothetical protein
MIKESENMMVDF